MKWVLVVMLAGKAPYDTGMIYDTINQCYAAEDEMAKSQTDYLNQWMVWARQHPESGYRDPPKGSGEQPVFPQFMLDRISRGVCAPHK